MADKHLIDCYVATRGIDFVTISFITSCDIPHKVELTAINAVNEQKNDSNEQKGDNQIMQSQILQSCNQSTKDSKYRFQQQVFFWYCKFEKLRCNQQYKFVIFINKDNKEIYSSNFNTLKPPKGKLLFRFGILADSHINLNYVNKMSYGKRLYHKANELCSKYIDKIANDHKANFIIFPGDICDCGSKQELNVAKKLLLENKSNIKCYPIIGNHESYSTGSPKLFYETFNLGHNGFYSFDYDKYHFIMICAPDQQDLNDDTNQYKWLCNQLEENKDKICFIFTHYSFVLHSCVSGYKNDGMQQFYNHNNLLTLFKKYNKSLRVIFAGHKNVPSVVLKDNIYHLLCPQLIQSPCSYDIIDIYENGLIKNTFEIDEKCLIYQSRVNCGESDWKQRFGTYKDRNFAINDFVM